jgi:DNA-binding IclR family transcriptional regulator
VAGRPKTARRRNGGVPAADAVLDAIKRSKQGLKFADLQSKTGYPDKKIRNIIFRLNKLGKIKRHTRGVYVAL